MTQTKGFHIVRRPEGIVSQIELAVVDTKGHPHLALTRFYQRLRQELSDGAARTYLMALLPYFSFLETDHWCLHRQDRWDGSPESIRESARDYLESWGYLSEEEGGSRRTSVSVEHAYVESQQQLARLQFELLEQQQLGRKPSEN